MKNISIKIISAIAIFALTFGDATSSSSISPIPGQKEKKKADREKQLEGIDIDMDGKRATLKKGYAFVNRTGNKVSVARQNIGGGSGDTGVKVGIECTCLTTSKSNCKITITHTIATCSGAECCRMIVTIPASEGKPRLEN